MMKQLRSIRWQLPLSYAAIALVAALVLGMVLLGILRRYYTDQEYAFLLDTAEGASQLVSWMVADDMPDYRLASPLNSLARFSGTRITLSDHHGNMLVDTGQTRQIVVSLPLVEPADGPPPLQDRSQTIITIIEGSVGSENRAFNRDVVGPEYPQDERLNTTLNITGFEYFTPEYQLVPRHYGGSPARQGSINDEQIFYFSAEPAFGGGFSISEDGQQSIPATRDTSDLSVSVDLIDQNQGVVGTLTVSNGPAYGADILNSVVNAWIVASAVAVLLAAISGWIISLRLTAPLTELTQTTTKMAAGDLTARSDVNRADELGILASAFNNMAERIEGTVESLRRFVADAAHEIHTPLTALRTDLELAGEAAAPADTRHALSQVQRLQQLVDDLLDLSRLEASGAADSRQSIDLSQMIYELSEIYASRAEQADIFFDMDVSETTPIIGDPGQLQRMIANLLDNAIKFTPEGGDIRIALQQNARMLTLSIADTGIGIPEADLSSLFDRFHRGRNTATYLGSGLGLAIVKAVVHGHGGSVSVRSELGAGTTFEIQLPTP